MRSVSSTKTTKIRLARMHLRLKAIGSSGTSRALRKTIISEIEWPKVPIKSLSRHLRIVSILVSIDPTISSILARRASSLCCLWSSISRMTLIS